MFIIYLMPIENVWNVDILSYCYTSFLCLNLIFESCWLEPNRSEDTYQNAKIFSKLSSTCNKIYKLYLCNIRIKLSYSTFFIK